ncbi:MAG: RrF2 family transcriptional regulator [Armatimonadota bacterium]
MIRLNLSTDYALRTLLFLASRPGGHCSTREVAEFYEISADHVSKVVQTLARAGVVRAERGRGGGIRLARKPADVTVGEIVELFEGPVALLACVNTDDVCTIQPSCRLRLILDDAGRQLILRLRQVTLSDLAVPEPAALIQLEPAAK